MSGVGAPSDGECVCISACEHVCMIRFSTGSKAEIFLFAYYYDRLAVELVVTWLIFEPRKPQKSVRELFFDSSESCFSKPATGRKDSYSWLHEFAREAQAVMRRKATRLLRSLPSEARCQHSWLDRSLQGLLPNERGRVREEETFAFKDVNTHFFVSRRDTFGIRPKDFDAQDENCPTPC